MTAPRGDFNCSRCRRPAPLAVGRSVICCAHVDQHGRPCTDTLVWSDYTRQNVVASASEEGIRVWEWQLRNLDSMELDPMSGRGHSTEDLTAVLELLEETLIQWTEGHASDICMCLWCIRLRELMGVLPL